ncbi:MAG: hypothetical protein KDD35_07170, partial [Bdellovibrionales bacterium]|nr:hypothetical protein [Bdellovibrionales bacterium]
MEKHGEKRSVIRSAASMSLGTILSRILGLVRDIVLAAYFSKTVTDAFVVAFRLPNMFRRLLGEGSLSVSFLPIYIERKTPKANVSPEAALSEAKDLSNGIFTLLVLVTGVLSLAGIIWMDELMNLLVGGHGFKSVEGKLSITVWMARIMFAYMFLVTLYAFYMAIANSWQKFFIFFFCPDLFNLVFIFFVLIHALTFVRPPVIFFV